MKIRLSNNNIWIEEDGGVYIVSADEIALTIKGERSEMTYLDAFNKGLLTLVPTSSGIWSDGIDLSRLSKFIAVKEDKSSPSSFAQELFKP